MKELTLDGPTPRWMLFVVACALAFLAAIDLLIARDMLSYGGHYGSLSHGLMRIGFFVGFWSMAFLASALWSDRK